MSNDATPAAEVAIDDALVHSLLAAQHPDLSPLPLGERFEGWDNVTLRLGDHWAVRLPRRAMGAALTETELTWLPRVGASWSFAAPVPSRRGAPGEGFPWSWAVVPWIHGTAAYDAPLDASGARDLGAALAEVHRPVDADAPVNPFRSVALSARAERLDVRLDALEAEHPEAIDGARARHVFAEGARQARGELTWTHLDLHGANVLTRSGRLAGIIDWGDAAAGDPATDLGQALTLVGTKRFRDVLRGYIDAGGAAATKGGIDEGVARRIEAEAVGYAVTLASTDDPVHRPAGWAALADLGLAEAPADALRGGRGAA